MFTIKQYAESKGVSHQAVYKQLQTHADELEPYIITRGRTRYLTNEAVDILEKYRESNTQIVERTNDKEKIAELENQIKLLLSEKSGIEKELREALKWKADKALEIARAEQNQALLEDKSKKLEEKEQLYLEAKKENQEKDGKIKQLQDEVDSFGKPILGFYRKKKEK